MVDLMNFQQAIIATYSESCERVGNCVNFVMSAICDNYDFAIKKYGPKPNDDDDLLKKPFDAMAPIFNPDDAPKAEPKKDQESCPILNMTVLNYDKPIISAEIMIPRHLHLNSISERNLFDELLKRAFHRFDMDTLDTKISKSGSGDIITVVFTYDAYVPVTEAFDADFFKSRLLYAFGDTPEGIEKGNDPRPVVVMSTINAAVLIYADEYDSTFRVDVWKANAGRKKEEEAILKYSINSIEEYPRAILVARELCHLDNLTASKPVNKMLHRKYSYCNGCRAYVMPKYDADAIKYGMNDDTKAVILNKDNDDDNVMAQFDDTNTANIICSIINYTPRQSSSTF